LHHDNAQPHTMFFTKEFLPKTTWLSSPTHPTFSVSPIEDKTEMPPFWWKQNHRCWTPSPLPGCI
jgi:hypothetical protein